MVLSIHPVGSDKCRTTCIHHCSVIQTIRCPDVPLCPPAHPPPPFWTPGNPWSFYCLQSFPFPASLWFLHFSKLFLRTLQRIKLFLRLIMRNSKPSPHIPRFTFLRSSQAVLLAGPSDLHLLISRQILTWPLPLDFSVRDQVLALLWRMRMELSFFHPVPPAHTRLSSIPTLPF